MLNRIPNQFEKIFRNTSNQASLISLLANLSEQIKSRDFQSKTKEIENNIENCINVNPSSGFFNA